MAKWKFTPTKAMQSMVSEQIAEGDRFELMVTFEPEGSEWCIVEIEGIQAPGYGKENEEQSKPNTPTMKGPSGYSA